MLIYTIIALAVIFPLIAPSKGKDRALMVSFILLFIPWGLQYQVTEDWPVYVERWQTVQMNDDTIGKRVLEGGYVWLMKLCSPIGFFGFLIVCAIFFLSILHLFIKNYVAKEWYWLVILVLMSNMKLGFLLIDTNRQTIAVGFSMLSMFLLLYEGEKWGKIRKYKYIIALILMIFASQVHTSAYVAFLLFPILYIVKHVKRINFWISAIVFNVLYFGRYLLHVDFLQKWILNIWVGTALMTENNEFFSLYMEQMENENERSAIIEYFVSLFFCHSFLLIYNKLNVPYRFFGICMIIFYIGEGYLTMDLPRVLLYMNIYSILLVPQLFQYPKNVLSNTHVVKNPLLLGSLILVILIHMVFFYNGMTTNIYYKQWKSDFTTILEAPGWM